MRAIPRRLVAAAMASAALVAVGLAQDNATDAARLSEVLQVAPGSVLADIGAGTGALLTIPMAARVGPSGKIYASEMAGRVAALRRHVQQAAVRNVEVIEADDARTNLPPACCDGIFIRNVYHHFGDPAAMNASLFASLKPGGRLAVIDFRPTGSEATSPVDRDEGDQHGVEPETVTRELVQAGFRVAATENRPDGWFLVAVQKPAE
jgi:predicted methyltransferase